MTGPPHSICRRNKGTTDPEDSSTLPKRTMENTVAGCFSDKTCRTISAMRLVAPITLVGRTALSEEIRTKWPVPAFAAA